MKDLIYRLSDNKLLGSNNLFIFEPIFIKFLNNKILPTVDPYMALFWVGVVAPMPTRANIHFCRVSSRM